MSTLPPDPYKTLGVSKDAQLGEIRQAHRKLVLRCHPDKVQDPKLKEDKQREFQQVQQAYELLSNDTERARYDDKVRLEELRRDRGMTSTSASSPRTSKRSESKYYDVREAEPRPSTFASSPGSHNVYGHTPPSRSWDEDIYVTKREYEKPPRHARKTQSYEYEKPKPSRKDEERLKRKEEEEWAREKEKARAREKEIKEAERHRDMQRERDAMVRDREREKDRDRGDREKELTKKDKDRRKDERKEDKKKSEKERRKESDDKHRRHNKSPYVEEPEEIIFATSSSSKPEKKPSSSRKYEEAVPPPPPRDASHPPELVSDRERKYSNNLESAIRYLSRSGGKAPPISRAQTFHTEHAFRHITPIAVPTPPPAAGAMFAPPPVSDPRDAPLEDDAAKRSSTRARRMSHDTPRSSKEKPSHKKSSSSRDPLIVEASSPTPAARIVPSFQKSSTMPIPIHRSTTEDYSSRPPVAPGLERAATWMAESGRGRERSHSRHNRGYIDESSEDDRDRRHHRSRRTQSPEVMSMPHTHTTKRYTVERNTSRAIPVESSYFPDDTPRSSRKGHPSANSSARRADPRYHDDYDEEPRPFFSNIRYADQFDANDIKFSDVTHTPYREEVYT
ncbi:DnaJ-domain-containing protein [Hypoxylon rubiginosum]|uniref:DnaJ-domain-containing protein n=1 Tax=Hypoxylon rubiginosum TaxID=110542 RepID=A0ACB9Z0S9_9PEZI|nr:DnaJ-domain-containing protein [Hypoxylon rubiginosum]